MAAEKRDYYEVLGVSKDASESELKKAFFKIAKENHPDLHPGDKECEAKIREANEAYEVLSNAEKRAKYDQFGFAGVDPNYAAQNGGTYGGYADMDINDILGNLFGGFGGFGGGFSSGFSSGSARRNGPRQGDDIRIGISVSFEEAAFGCEQKVSFARIETCDECGGSGCQHGTTPEVCPECHGSGTVTQQRQTIFGVMATSVSCPKCGGKGKIIHQPCQKCKGKGRIRRTVSETVTVPKGIDNNMTFPVYGKGNVGVNGGPAGDLLVTVSIRPHEFFERENTSVLYELPITVTQAILGAQVEIPTIDGKVKCTVSPGTQSGDVLRLKGKGIPFIRGNGRGDQFITVTVNIPTELTAEQRELVIKLDESLGGSGAPNPKSKKFKKKK